MASGPTKTAMLKPTSMIMRSEKRFVERGMHKQVETSSSVLAGGSSQLNRDNADRPTISNKEKVDMSVKRRGRLPMLVVDNDAFSLPSRNEDSAEIKLHVKMDALTFQYIEAVKAILRTSSDQEVFRRALNAYEIFEVDVGSSPEGRTQPNEKPTNVRAFQKDKYINLSRWMKDVLDEAKDKDGKSYTQTLREALMILLQLARNTRDLKERMKAGDINQSSLFPVVL